MWYVAIYLITINRLNHPEASISALSQPGKADSFTRGNRVVVKDTSMKQASVSNWRFSMFIAEKFI